MTTRQARIATDLDRSAIAHLVCGIWTELDKHGVQAMLAKHPDQNLDVLAVQAIIAAVTRTDQKTPAILGLDGDHTNRARVALSRPQVTPAPLTVAELGAECGVCGVCQAMHRGARVLCDDIGPHDWVASPAHVPADAETIARIRPTFHRQEQQ